VGQQKGEARMALEGVPSIGTGSVSKQGWVLVIVRAPRLRQLLLTVLGRAGYTLLGCATLEEAGQVLAQRRPPRLILFDGAEASEARLGEQIHQIEASLPPGVRCRVIIFSLTHPQPRLQALPGVDALIARPFDLTQMLDKVEVLSQS
jgi:response regulator RpfG family c-di-GMP phosphodiesterase